jgi:hypothetical protein
MAKHRLTAKQLQHAAGLRLKANALWYTVLTSLTEAPKLVNVIYILCHSTSFLAYVL